jgi:hypothetical protein
VWVHKYKLFNQSPFDFAQESLVKVNPFIDKALLSKTEGLGSIYPITIP